MKFTLHLLLILVSLFNQAIAFRPISYAPGQPKAQVGVGTTATPAFGAYPPPVSPTPTPIPTAMPTAIPTPQATPTPAPRTVPVAPAPTSRLSLKTNLNCVVPGQDLSLDWDFQPAPEWAGRESELELVVSLPPAFTPESKGLTRFDAQSGAARLPLSKTGKIRGKLDQENTGALTVNAKVVNGAKVVAETAFRLGEGHLFDVAARGGEVADLGSRVKITFPEGALNEDIQLCIREAGTDSAPRASLSGHAFEINAEGKNSKAAVRRFGSPIQITYHYPENEVAGDGSTLSLVYYNEDTHQWDYLPSTVDTVNHRVIGYSTHLTLFDYDVNAIDKYKFNDLSVFQVSTFTGTATYSYPLNLPPGPGGFNQSLALTYNSGVPDGSGYYTQASWVGMGWDLEPGSITRNTRGTTGLGDDTFSLSFSGGGGMLLPASTGTDSFGHFIEYQTQNINYLRIRMYDARSSSSGVYYQDQSIWRVWDQSGNLYTFGATMEYINYGVLPVQGEIYKWFLSNAKSVAGKEYVFNYAKTNVYRNDGVVINGILYDLCGNCSSTTIAEMYLDNIQYPDNSYYVHFERKDRQDYSKACYESVFARCFADKKYLSSITVYYNPDRDGIAHAANNNPDGAGNADAVSHSGLQQVRKYVLTYAADDSSGAGQRVFPGVHWQDTAGYVLTLLKITEQGKDGGELPATAFTYGDQMHLTEVNNGYNGKMVFEYEATPWAQDPANFYPAVRGYRETGMIWDEAAMSYSGAASESDFAPGKKLWMRIGARTREAIPQGITVHTGINLPDGRYLESPSQNVTVSAATDYYFVITLPADMPKTSGGNQYTVQFWCGAPLAGTHCEMESVEWGQTPSRYRVTKRKVYPQAVDFANPSNPNLPHYDYTYQYTGASLNPIDASKAAFPTRADYNYVSQRRLSKPYSEFRGHSQVTVTQPDGSSIVYTFQQGEQLAGRLMRVALYRGVNQAKFSETIYTYTSLVQILSNGVNDQMPKYRIDPNAYIYEDAQVWWADTSTVEKHIYASDGVSYIGNRTDTTYVLDGDGKPVYGKVRSVIESENHGAGWTVVRKKFLSYTAPDVNDNLRYFVGHPSSVAICSANGSTDNAEYQICGSNANDYYGFTSYYYNDLGQVSEVRNLLNFIGAPTTSYLNRYSDFTRNTYDNYGNVVMVEQGGKYMEAEGVVLKTTTLCYKEDTSDCDEYSGVGVNGVYLSWEKNALNQVTHYENDPRLGQPLKQIDPNGAEISVTYDQYGRLATVRKPYDSGTGVMATLQFAYHYPDASSKFFWTEATQKLDETKTLKVRKFYNGIGELTQTQQVGVKVADAVCGAETCMTVSDQKTEYGSGVKMTTQTAPYAAATLSGYVTPTWQNVTVTTYDAEGRPLMVKGPGQTAANSQRYSYEVNNGRQITTATDPKGNATESWQDVWSRTVKVKPPVGPTLEYEYDVANRLKVVRQIPQGGGIAFATTTINYDVAGRKTSMVDPDMGAWSYAYDALGNLVRQTDAKNQSICLYYDTLNRLTGKHYRGNTVCPDAVPALDVSYSYDAYSTTTGSENYGIGRRTGMSNRVGSLSNSASWRYDARGRVTQETKTITDVGTYTTSWTYTSADRIATMTYPKGNSTIVNSEVVTYDYLPQGTLTKLTSSYGQVYLNSAAVDALGRPTVFNLGNGTQTKYSYYPWTENNPQSGRLQKLQSGSLESFAAGTPGLQSFQYTYDWAGNITSIAQKVGNQANETLSYTYDELNRLTSETTSANPSAVISSTYSAATGNLATKANKTLGYGAQAANCPDGALPAKVHAATSLDGTTNAYCYDPNGNMTRRKIGANTYTLSYDPENRLKQISGGGGPTYDYVYDGDGQRVLVKKQVGTDQFDKTIYIGGHFEVFIKASYSASPTPVPNCGVGRSCIYLPLNITTFINPTATAGQVWKSYYSTGAGQVVRVQDNAGMSGSGLFWLYTDHLGSTTVTARMGGFEAALVSTLSYTAWGETRASSGTTPTSMRYTGQREAEAGLYFYKARWYDPALGRFAQADTIVPDPGSAIGWDRYAGMHNNPVNLNDPTGHLACGVGYNNKHCEQYDLGGYYNDPNDTDSDGIPNNPDPNFKVSIGVETGCQHSSYTECFYDRELLIIDGKLKIDNDQFYLLMMAVFIDIRNRSRNALDRMAYDTPFWDANGGAPGKVCWGETCYGRAEVNYFAQGMWSAANGESLEFGKDVIVGAWKWSKNLFQPTVYTSSVPSPGTLYWFEIGYRTYHILNQNYDDLITKYAGSNSKVDNKSKNR